LDHSIAASRTKVEPKDSAAASSKVWHAVRHFSRQRELCKRFGRHDLYEKATPRQHRGPQTEAGDAFLQHWELNDFIEDGGKLS
jgi:hypothetical protein